MKKSFSHFTKSGDAQMVDIYGKDITERMAVASGKIYMSNTSIEMVRDGSHKKGDVLGIARIAGITASKKTPDLIPLCHNIELSSVNTSGSSNLDWDFFSKAASDAARLTVEVVFPTPPFWFEIAIAFPKINWF